MKTYQEWMKSHKNLSEFLQVGDVVDEEMYFYFLEVLPPACMSSRCVQIGEPYSHDEGGPLYDTLIKKNDQWIYAGHRNTPKKGQVPEWLSMLMS